MIKSIKTLKKRSEFLAVSKSKYKIATKGLVLQALPRVESEYNDFIHVGFTVTKKVGNAVIRNRVKRRLRALAREIIKDGATSGKTKKFLMNPEWNYVLIGRKATITRSFSGLQKDLKYALYQVLKEV